MVTLNDLRVGDFSKIIELKRVGSPLEEGDEETIRTLWRLGVIPGAELQVVAKAMGGDPIAIDTRGARLALGKREAQLVQVEGLSK
jgi:Fe2+ transport system protein FeoA